MDRRARLTRLIGYRNNIQAQIDIYEILLGRKIDKDELESLEDWDVKSAGYPLKGAPEVKFIMNLSQLGSDSFGQYLARLESNSNSDRIGIWTKYSDLCGRFAIRSFRELHFPFPINLDGEIFGFTTEDFLGALMFEWDSEDIDSTGEIPIEVTARGVWADAAIPLPDLVRITEG